MVSRNPKIEFDQLQQYFGEPYVIDLPTANGSITVYEPTIGDIIRLGEKRFYSTLNIFVCNTTSYRLPLWRAGIDWNIMSDFELFCTLYQGIDPDVAKIMFGDLDFSKFEVYEKNTPVASLEKEESTDEENNDSEEPTNKVTLVLYDAEDDIEINEEVYHHFCQCLRYKFNIYPEEKITNQRTMKEVYIMKDERQEKNSEEKAKKGELNNSSIQSIISACVNHPGFKYKLHELREVGVCEFYDSVKRLQVYENTTALLKGMYSGMIDSSKIKPESYNFMCSLN